MPSLLRRGRGDIKLPCIFVLNVYIFFKVCRHIMNFHVPGIHYRFTFSAMLILGINNFQCNLDIHGVVFNLALLYYLFSAYCFVQSYMYQGILTILSYLLVLNLFVVKGDWSYSNDLPL